MRSPSFGGTITGIEGIVAQRDRAAADYLKRFYGVDWSDSLLYHLILNTGRWGIESGSRLIVNAVSQLQPMAALN